MMRPPTHAKIPDGVAVGQATPSVSRCGIAPTRVTLDNGVVVLAKETNRTPAVTINLAVRGGFVCDPVESPGAMSLLSRVIDRGTAARSATGIAEELDTRGITLNVGVTRHVFSLVCTCLSEDFDAVLELIGDVMMSPSLPEPEILTRKGEAITAIRQDEDNPAVRSVEALLALLYSNGHPYGRRPKGTIESVEAIGRDALADLHRQRFSPSALTAVIVGDVPVGRAADSMSRVFGGWRHPPSPPERLPQPQRASQRQRLVIPMMNKAQADIAYGFVAIDRSDPAYYAHWLMNNVLGQYSIGGRLGDSIRERQGMAYYVFSSLDADLVQGPLLIRAGVSRTNVDRAIASIDDELRSVAGGGITEKELNDSRQYLIGSTPRVLETNGGIAGFLQTASFFDLGLDYDLRFPDLLRAVTLEDVHAAARTALDPDRAAVVVAGPYEGLG
jgi:zinc protease